MANLVKRQVIEDGPRNMIVKIVGVLDTSDVAATGTIGASGFTTTLGSNAVAFVAGALVPTLGQYLTFGDGVATFVAGTYITSIVDATHITVNNVALKNNAAAAVTITGTAGAVVAIDPALLFPIGSIEGLPNRVAVEFLQYNIEDTLSVYLYWEATANDLIVPLEGRGHIPKHTYWRNTEAAGVTGKLLLATQGWAASAVLGFAIEISVKKYIK